jgi:ABC-2 type transport system ATP-binding protein
MWGIIRDLVSEGVTVLPTTQYLEEADQLADRVAVLHNGRISAHGTPEELKRLVPGGHVRLRFTDPAAHRRAAALLAPGAPTATATATDATGTATATATDEDALTLRVPHDGTPRALRALLDRLDAAGVEPAELTVHTPDLDDVFFTLTDDPARPAGSRPADKEATR